MGLKESGYNNCMNEQKELRFTFLMIGMLIIASIVISTLTMDDRELTIDEMKPLHEDINFTNICKTIC